MRRHEAICHNIRTIVDHFQEENVLMLGERPSFCERDQTLRSLEFPSARVRTSLGLRGVLFHSSLSSSTVIVYKVGERKYKLSWSIETNTNYRDK